MAEQQSKGWKRIGAAWLRWLSFLVSIEDAPPDEASDEARPSRLGMNNPATGLRMIDGFDTAGNRYGESPASRRRKR